MRKGRVVIDEGRELDLQNAGCEIASSLLLKIAHTGDHPGVFGGKTMEEAAQAILVLRKRVHELKTAMRKIKDKNPDDPDVESWKWLARWMKDVAATALEE